jgi:hypothetical protein
MWLMGGAKPTGWSNYRIIIDYLKHFIACEISVKEDPVRLILYKYDPHLSIPANIVAKENDIFLIILPPHTSHNSR